MTRRPDEGGHWARYRLQASDYERSDARTEPAIVHRPGGSAQTLDEHWHTLSRSRQSHHSTSQRGPHAAARRERGLSRERVSYMNGDDRKRLRSVVRRSSPTTSAHKRHAQAHRSATCGNRPHRLKNWLFPSPSPEPYLTKISIARWLR